MLCQPVTCFFPLECPSGTVVNKLTLSSTRQTTFAIRATHQFDVDVEPKSGTLACGVPVSIFVKWKGALPKNVSNYEGLKPQRSPKLRIDSPSSPSITVDIDFSFPNAAAGFCYTLDGLEWLSNVTPSVVTAMGSAASSEFEMFTPRDVASMNGGARGTGTAGNRSGTVLDVALGSKEAERAEWLSQQKNHSRVVEIEVALEQQKRQNALLLQREIEGMKRIVHQKNKDDQQAVC
eukprot:PhF_6_TR42390/c0_g1_i1/m.63945